MFPGGMPGRHSRFLFNILIAGPLEFPVCLYVFPVPSQSCRISQSILAGFRWTSWVSIGEFRVPSENYLRYQQAGHWYRGYVSYKNRKWLRKYFTHLPSWGPEGRSGKFCSLKNCLISMELGTDKFHFSGSNNRSVTYLFNIFCRI